MAIREWLAASPSLHRAFVAGLSNGYAVTETRGESRGAQIDFTPLGAYRFLALPMDSNANRVIELDEVFGSAATDLIEMLAEALEWEGRFVILDEWIGSRTKSLRRIARHGARDERDLRLLRPATLRS